MAKHLYYVSPRGNDANSGSWAFPWRTSKFGGSMRKHLGKALLFSSLLFCVAALLIAQTGTPHGINVTITPPATVGGSGTIQGYYLFRCTGSAASCPNTSLAGWTAVGALIAAPATNPNTTAVKYLDPAAGLSVNTTYSYTAQTVDSNGSRSDSAGDATIAVANFPTNPNAPGVQTSVQ